MESWIARIAQHGYLILFAVAFLETFGLPIPAALALLVAGAACARGLLNPWLAVGGAIASIAAGDTLMFLLGRHTGWWLLSLLCRLSFNPESCILRSADAFYRRGRTLLVFAKFIPGINTMAPPLAGSMNMRYAQFARLDAAGAALYAGGYFTVGFLFSDALESLTRGYETFGQILAWIVAAAVALYLGTRIWAWRKARELRQAPFVEPAEAARELSAGKAVVYDVRSHGYYEPKAMRIEGSRRLDPNALNQVKFDFPLDKQVFVYCTCAREATSAQVAHILRQKGVLISVIKGGLHAWKKAGLPLEAIPAAEVAFLPAFDTRT
jgi:membrane protein DedA with SNARE-associated domain/rhodanese-related sulfurtransferase